MWWITQIFSSHTAEVLIIIIKAYRCSYLINWRVQRQTAKVFWLEVLCFCCIRAFLQGYYTLSLHGTWFQENKTLQNSSTYVNRYSIKLGFEFKVSLLPYDGSGIINTVLIKILYITAVTVGTMTTLRETSQNHAAAPIKARVWDCWLSNDWQLVKITGLICYQSFSKLLPGRPISFSST